MQDNTPPSVTTSDPLDPNRSTALQAALGLPPTVDVGFSLPPFFHHLYFWEVQPPEKLGRDGHPRVGGIIPDMGLPRRMWAGGQLLFRKPLLAGISAEKRTTLEKSVQKIGRTGPLGFVTLRHDIHQNDQLCVTEYQDLVYREDPSPTQPQMKPPLAAVDEGDAREYKFNSTLLFRYSALTFNGHRIHYDLDYARDVEGYGGLVVHGPLLAQLLVLMAKDQLGELKEFEFRATAPLMHHETATLCWKGNSFWVRGPDGRQCMLASAS